MFYLKRDLFPRIEELYAKAIAKQPTKDDLRVSMRKGIHKLAESFGYEAGYNYAADVGAGSHFGSVDVVWMQENEIHFAFKIDGAYRQWSYKKVQRTPARHRIWVYYGRREPDPLVQSLNDPEVPVHVVRLPAYSARSRRNTE